MVKAGFSGEDAPRVVFPSIVVSARRGVEVMLSVCVVCS
jgi:actin-related protein